MNTVQPIRDQYMIESIKKYLKIRSLRDYLLFCVGIYSGLRVSDLLMLRVGMVRNETYINITEMKTKNRKRFIIHPSIRDDLELFIHDKHDFEYLFASRQIKTKSRLRGQPIDRSTAYRMLDSVAKHFDLKDIGTHSLRKTWGYHLYLQDKRNLALLMEMFNHGDQTTTLRYIGTTQDMMDEAILRLP